MSKSDSMFIAFPNGGIVPGAVAGGKDRKVGPHEPVKVPRDYGASLVDDRFAYEADPATAKAARSARKPEADTLAELAAALKKSEADIAVREAAVKDVETALTDREAAIAKAEADVAARETAVKDAEAALTDREAVVAKAEAEMAKAGKSLFEGQS